MGYGLLETYGLWCAFPRPPTRWTGLAMGYYRLWVFTGMGYNRFDCICGKFGFICSGPLSKLILLCFSPSPVSTVHSSKSHSSSTTFTVSEENGLLEDKVFFPSKKGTTMRGMGGS